MQAIGRYRVLQEVARGSAGAVHRAVAPDGRAVAVKLLLAGRAATAMQRRRFAGEVQALLRLRHPHVVGLLDAGDHEGVPFLVTEWIEGETLGHRLHRAGVLEPRAAAMLGRALASALEHCHGQGILHRDLKPENVLLRADPAHPDGPGTPLLTDFGLAKDLLPAAVDASHGTVQGVLLGTPGYWPPEQARGELAAIGPRSDVYGLCAIVWAAIVGRAPQRGTNLQALLRELDAPPMAPGALAPGVPGWLDALLVRGLDPRPERRPASAAELELALREGLARVETAGRIRPALAASAALLGVGGLAAFLVLQRPAAERDAPEAAIASSGAQTPSPTDAPPPSAAPAVLGPAQLAARGLARLRADDAAGAREDCAKALAADPRLVEGLLLQSRIRAAADRVTRAEVQAAIAVIDRVIEEHPGHAEAWHTRGDLRGQLDDVPGQERDLRRSLELDPRVLEVVVHLVELHESRGERPEALALLDRFLLLDPREPNALRSRAALRAEAGDRAGARADLDLAIEVAPRDALCWLGRANLLLDVGEHDQARKDCQRALELDPRSADAWMASAHLSIDAGDLSGAEQDLSRAIEHGPGNATLWFSRGMLRQKRGARVEALADFDRAIQLEPQHADALLARAAQRRAMRDLVGARDDLSRLLQAQPRNLGAWITRATVHVELGDAVAARADADRCLELDPDLLEGWILRARALELANDLAGAAAAYDRLLEQDQHVPQLLVRRAGIKKKQGDQAGARADLERALALPWEESAKADRELAAGMLKELQ